MELLTPKKRLELQDLLLSLPNIGDSATRDLLLADLAGPAQEWDRRGERTGDAHR